MNAAYTPVIVQLANPLTPATLAALREEVAAIVTIYPDLGVNGFAVPYVSPAVAADYLSSELFAIEVAKGLECLSKWCVGLQPLCRSEGIAYQFKICPAAVIVACSIAGYRVARINGQRHAHILRGKK